MSTSISLAPLLPWLVLAPLLAAGLLALGYALLRRARGALWRGLLMTALGLALLNPSLVTEQRAPIKDVAVVVVDQSPSQAIGERRARGERALAAVQKQLARENDLEVRVVRAGGEAAGGGVAVEETRLFDALTRAVADVPRRRLAGALLITDGQVHDVPANAETVAGMGPIHTLLTGEKKERDRRLHVVQAPSFGLVGKPVTVVVRVDDLPAEGAGGGEAILRVRDGDGAPHPVAVRVGADTPIDFPVQHGGMNVLEMEVEPGPEELTLANNRAAVVVNGVRDRLRVLLVSGEPHAGERTWRNLLKADPAVDLVHFTILRPPEKQDGTPIRELSLIAFPTRELFELKLDEFDLIIFDRYRRRGVLPQAYLENIARYVEKGGAFLEASGPAYAGSSSLASTPLRAVLPGEPTGEVMTGPFKPAVTDTGRRHPVTAGLAGAAPDGVGPWGSWFRQVGVAARRGAVVMSGADGAPLLVLDRVGEGRVAQLTSDQIWLWSRGFEGGGPQAELLRRLAHWLMKEPELEENVLRARVEGARITVERHSLEPDARPVEITSPSDQKQSVTLADGPDGIASATIIANEAGIWRLSDGERSALAVVGALNPPELQDMRTTADRMAPVAEASQGGIYWLAEESGGAPEVRRVRPDRAAAGHGWLGLRRNGDYVVTGANLVPLLPTALLVLLVVGGLMTAWWREGR
jgi:hypothetical protein